MAATGESRELRFAAQWLCGTSTDSMIFSIQTTMWESAPSECLNPRLVSFAGWESIFSFAFSLSFSAQTWCTCTSLCSKAINSVCCHSAARSSVASQHTDRRALTSAACEIHFHVCHGQGIHFWFSLGLYNILISGSLWNSLERTSHRT